MNFLGHIYLSGTDDQLMIGNFIGDYVKGMQYIDYPTGIIKGILLHRSIDSFTDKNENFLLIKSKLKPAYGLYAGVVADLFTDHFLAANWENYHPIELKTYTSTVYKIMRQHYEYLPARIKGFFTNLVERNRLLSYSQISGIEEALMIMAFRTSLPERTKEAMAVLRDNYYELQIHAEKFLAEVIVFTEKELNSTLVAQTGWHRAEEI
jgi:acyl carrier protein phosphodiesterase